MSPARFPFDANAIGIPRMLSLAAIKKTNIAASANPLGIPVAFASNGNLAGNYGYLFKINSAGKYVEISPK